MDEPGTLTKVTGAFLMEKALTSTIDRISAVNHRMAHLFIHWKAASLVVSRTFRVRLESACQRAGDWSP